MTEKELAALVIAGARVRLPSLDLDGYHGWLCKVCLRGLCRDAERWSWLGCAYCRAVDHRLASALGGHRFLALGRHSIMNGVALRLSEEDESAIRAVHDEFMALGDQWSVLERWRETRSAELAAEVSAYRGDDAAEVPLPWWQALLRPGLRSSAREYRDLLREHYPEVLDLDPRFSNVIWLSGTSQPSTSRSATSPRRA